MKEPVANFVAQFNGKRHIINWSISCCMVCPVSCVSDFSCAFSEYLLTIAQKQQRHVKVNTTMTYLWQKGNQEVTTAHHWQNTPNINSFSAFLRNAKFLLRNFSHAKPNSTHSTLNLNGKRLAQKYFSNVLKNNPIPFLWPTIFYEPCSWGYFSVTTNYNKNT